jgi:hypothetical protein
MKTGTFIASVVIAAAVLIAAAPAFAHCDSLDGPVVKAAERALESRDVNYVLIWVQPEFEAEIREVFARALEVRALTAPAKVLADRYFFETVVRIHRAGEGAAFTGLKPAGQDAGPAISAADRALSEGSMTSLMNLLSAELSAGLRRHFEEVVEARLYDSRDVAAGRRFVTAYVEYVHYVERLHEAIAMAAPGHFPQAPR